MKLLTIIFFIVSIIVFIQTTYSIILSFWGFKNYQKDYKIIDPKARFLILVAAHNEGAVIKSTLENLKKIQYTQTLFDIVVINDNSTDNTKDICDEMNIRHIDTDEKLFLREAVGKPGAIQYALHFLGLDNINNNYDLIMILDADNHVDSNILTELNSQFYAKNKPEVIQTYLDSKNSSSILSLGYAHSYTTTNRFFQLAKYKLNLPNAIGGTGFVMRADYLKSKGGFICNSLTEDLELEMEVVKDGGQVIWNHFARIYDEKPDKISASIRQRIRWCKGHWFVAFKYVKPLFSQYIKSGFKLKYLDQIFYLFSMAKVIYIPFCLVGMFFSFSWGNFNNLYFFIIAFIHFFVALSPVFIFLFIYNTLILLPYSIRKDNLNHNNNIFYSIIATHYYSFTFILPQLIGLFTFKNQGSWAKTTHKHTEITTDTTSNGIDNSL